MTTLRDVRLSYETPGGEQVTVRLRCDPEDPLSFAAIYRTKDEALRAGAKPDCGVKLNENNGGRIEVVARERGRKPPMKNDPGCIQFKDGTWWCPGNDDDLG
jgi:hypothetical protein